MDKLIEIEGAFTYESRFKKAFQFFIWFTLFFLIFIFLVRASWYVIFFLIFYLFLYYCQTLNEERYYIFRISFVDNKLILSYNDKNEKYEVEDYIEKITIKKRFKARRTRVPYLVFYIDNKKIVQSHTGFWNEEKMDEVLNAFKYYKSEV